MLDTTEIFKELDDILAEGYTALRQQQQTRVRVYNPTVPTTRPPQALPAPQRSPARPAPKPKANPITEFIANTCLLFFLTVLRDRLANQ
ncbi:MAG: hypothetical protein U0350_45965 [Caldilineaceae bacterium]